MANFIQLFLSINYEEDNNINDSVDSRIYS